MTTLAVVTGESDIVPFLRWSSRFAAARGFPLCVLALQRTKTPEDAVEIAADAEVEGFAAEIKTAGEESGVVFRLFFQRHKRYDTAVRAWMRQHGARQLILCKSGAGQSRERWRKNLLERVHSQVVLLRPGSESGQRCRRILVPVGGGPHARSALRLGRGMLTTPPRWADNPLEAEAVAAPAESPEGSDGTPDKPAATSASAVAAAQTTAKNDAHVAAVYIEPDIGENAIDVGIRIIEASMRAAGIDPMDELIVPRVKLADNPFDGISNVAEEGFDLLILGASERGPLRRILFGTVPERLMTRPEGTTVAMVRRGQPLRMRLRKAFENWVGRRVPQLNREERIDLFTRLQDGSRGNFDFYTLTGLATAIAALGLLQNSAAVVIGAMLVAPLMTPMIGAGLGIVQGNPFLARDSARSIFFGFLLALSIGLCAGGVARVLGFSVLDLEAINAPGELPRLIEQLDARVHPSVLDLMVALISGFAAAYANARSGLSSSLPGVAIAAALVPPIATAGLLMAFGRFEGTQEAIKLFVTNLVLIVLGAASAMFLLGVRANREQSRKVWSQRALLVLLLAAVVLFFVLGSTLIQSLLGS